LRLTIRHFFLGYDVALGRTWEFHDYLASRAGVDYHLHLIGRYPGPQEDLTARPYVTRRWTPPAASRPEVWIIRGWNHPRLVLSAALARYKHVPILMWQERPGRTWEAATLGQAARIQLRRLLLPVLFVPYRRGTIVLGLGQEGVKAFQKLSGGRPGYMLPWPSPVADACLDAVCFRKRQGAPLFLFLGDFTRLKAVDVIAEACETLWRSGLPLRVRYVGRGPLEGMLEQHVARSGGRAEICPFADRPTVIRHLQEADAVLLPSRRDGWGLPVHEGLASGVPVITSNACGAADLVAQSGCGRVVEAGNAQALAEAMAWVVSLTPEEQEQIREKALGVARQLTIPKLTEVLLSYCEEALQMRD
jgi:glycosyltransferase involved in cell wall biosynthesis